MPTYPQLMTSLTNWVKWVDDERRCIQDVTQGSNSVDSAQANLETLIEGTVDFTPNTQRQLAAAADTRRRQQLGALRASARAAGLPIFVEIAKFIGSDHVDNDQITDFVGFWRDQRDYDRDTADQRVTARAITFGAEPAASAAGIIFRLTGEHRAGDPIECGRHNQVKTFRVLSKNGAFNANIEIVGADGPVDNLDYQAGSARQAGFNGVINTTMIARGNPNPGGMVTNPLLTGNPDQTDDAAVTAINGWNIATASSPTFLIDATNVFQQGNSTSARSLSLSGNNGQVTLTQDIPAAAMANRFQPILPVVALRLTAGWTGTIDVSWGDKTQQFTEADLSAGDWVLIAPDRDQDLYPYNWAASAPQYTLDITNGAAVGTNELGIGAFFVVQMVRHQGIWNAILMDDGEPDLNDEITITDSNSAAGKIQDVLGFVFDDELSGEGFMNTTGTNLLADPT